eukprot:267030-Karenia_brevis.AAC.1
MHDSALATFCYPECPKYAERASADGVEVPVLCDIGQFWKRDDASDFTLLPGIDGHGGPEPLSMPFVFECAFHKDCSSVRRVRG